jgi:hypothetical protein
MFFRRLILFAQPEVFTFYFTKMPIREKRTDLQSPTSLLRTKNSLVEGRGARTHEESAVGLVGRADDAVGQGELDTGNQDLLDVGATNIGVGNLGNADDLDGAGASAVAGSHVGVAGLDSGVAGQLAVLLVHVVGAGAGIVTDPDTEVLDLKGLLLVDLLQEKR